MLVVIAYLTVILVWSTTPLGMAWSNETVHPTMAVLLRMLIATFLGLILIKAWRVPLPFTRQAIKLYCFSSIGIFGGMFSSYMAVQYITTGMVSLAFGMSPIITGLLALHYLPEVRMSKIKLLAISIAFIGLTLVFVDSLALAKDSWIGILLIMLGVVLFSFSAVLVKSVDINIHPAATTVGTLLFALPFYITAWLIADGSLPIDQWSVKSLSAIFYLGIFGSLIGFVCYFYVLQKLTASSVSLITMMTPVIAILLGSWLNNELVTVNIIFGACAIILGLAIYQRGHLLTPKRFKQLFNTWSRYFSNIMFYK